MDKACPFCSLRQYQPRTGQKSTSVIQSDTIATVVEVLNYGQTGNTKTIDMAVAAMA